MNNLKKLAIHHRDGSFSNRWIDYCNSNNINYKIVNCFDSDIINQLRDCEALLWHHHHGNLKDVLASKPILSALEHGGIKVFPNHNTSWYFDDKVAQKYLLEAIEAPMVPSHVFYDKSVALDWAESTDYPKVFKLKGGAGSANVKLVKNKNECSQLINKAFGAGFKQFDGKAYFIDSIKKYKSGTKNKFGVIKAFGRMIISTKYNKTAPKERGYAYFQDFLPNNNSDIRIIVIGNKAFGLKRMVRKGDFRASGSGEITYSISEIDTRCVSIAFFVSKLLKSQCLAFDFIFDENHNPLIVEISYGFAITAYDQCEGYWSDDMQFYYGSFNPQNWIIENILGTQ